jgi:hypothetical protein
VPCLRPTAPSPRRASASNRRAWPRCPPPPFVAPRPAPPPPRTAGGNTLKGRWSRMEPRFCGSTSQWKPLAAPAPASPPEPPCSRPFGRAPRGVGAGAPFGALPNRAIVWLCESYVCILNNANSDGGAHTTNLPCTPQHTSHLHALPHDSIFVPPHPVSPSSTLHRRPPPINAVR